MKFQHSRPFTGWISNQTIKLGLLYILVSMHSILSGLLTFLAWRVAWRVWRVTSGVSGVSGVAWCVTCGVCLLGKYRFYKLSTVNSLYVCLISSFQSTNNFLSIIPPFDKSIR